MSHSSRCTRRVVLCGPLAALLSMPIAGADTVAERLGHPADARLMILHADDLGMAHSVDTAIFEALEKGWVTSASIMVPCPWFPEVAQRASGRDELDLGIHLTLNSEWTAYRWGPVSPRALVPTLLDDTGFFPLTSPPVIRRASLADVETELRAQIERALEAGIHLTHLDSHMGTLFFSPELRALYRRLGRSYGLPVLVTRESVGGFPAAPQDDPTVLVDRVLGIGPGVARDEWRSSYEELLKPLPPGVYELIVHLGHDGAELRGATSNVENWGSAWRQWDLDLVSSPEFQQFLSEEGFILLGWADLAHALPRPER
jgi:predicted glycoside hydrolase/deacetylase ChbG (UPF0249 family)